MARVYLGFLALPRRLPALFGLVGGLSLAGCMGGGNTTTLRPLTPVPTTAVTSSSLPQPISGAQPAPVQSQTLADVSGIDPNAPFDSAAIATTLGQSQSGLPSSTAGGAAVTEDDLIGAWSATTPAATCAINLSLTTWQGGYRASTRNCGDAQVAGLAAWSVEGQQVILKGSDGATLARLFRTGPTRYAGQLETGQAVTVFR